MACSTSRWSLHLSAILGLGLITSLLGSYRVIAEEQKTSVEFNRDIRPILSDKCFACHGFDSKNRQADLRLDTLEGATDASRGEAAIVPGSPEKSVLWKRILETDPELIMPPPESHKTLDDHEKQTLKRWIEEGAVYQKHWAYEAPRIAAVPLTSQPIANEIDSFVGGKLDELKLNALPEASKEVLIRRLSFALTGLPPSRQEVEQFIADSSSDAYPRLVERYLNSPRFGEEMARYWLDVARYADTHGMHLDNERQTWAYRDWVVNAFNKNLGFDEFTIQQLAGDLLPNAGEEQLIATGYNRCNVTTSEGGSINEELIYRYAVDRTSTTISTWMGLTGGCAVCHDHKFDPISQREFYAMYAFFNSAADPAMDGNALLTQPVVKLEMPDIRSRQKELDAQIAAAQTQIDERTSKLTYSDPATAQPLPEAKVVENVWMEDEFPANGNLFASPGQPPMFVDAIDGVPVFSGKKALKRTDAGLAQDVWDQAKTPLAIPQGGILFANVYIDPTNPPKAIMLQYHKTGWLHRGIWGEYDAIPWGAANTTERVAMGPLPEVGKWTRLEIPVEKVGLTTGDLITGFAMTQFGGTVYWDKAGVAGEVNPATDPAQSFLAWWKQAAGKDVPGIPENLKALAKAGPQESDLKPQLLNYYLQAVCQTTNAEFGDLRKMVDQYNQQKTNLENSIPSTFIYRDLPSPRESFVMMRGAYNKPGEKVEPGVFAFLPPLQKSNEAGPASRLDLAKWLVSDNHPLTARVTVNRFWQQFFGTGLVKSSYDFGSQGELPSHPELLDWLALKFIASGWDQKQLIRQIVTSAAFRRDSRIERDILNRDPENRFYARGPRFRLDAEQIRDNALQLSGLLIGKMGGKGVKPYQPANIWEPVAFTGSNTQVYQQDSGEALYRRSLYTFLKRTAPPPFMSNFDGPNREQFCTRRERSNTPLQALQLMNDVQHIEAARGFAQRMLREGGSSADDRITFAFKEILSRNPLDEERAIVAAELEKHLERYRQDNDAAMKLISHGESKPPVDINSSELAAYTLIANMMLNLDETLTRN